MQSYETLTVKWGPLTTITLNRPERLNAISEAMTQDLYDVVQQVAVGKQETRALLLTGAGRGFCAGADLNARDELTDSGRALTKFYNPLMLELAALPVPVISAVNGIAAGAGCSLALSADFVLAGRSSAFLQAFINIGLIPDAGSSYWLPRMIGPARARRFMMLGEQLPAETAYDWGMIHAVVDDDTLLEEAEALADKLAQGPTRAYRAIREMVRASYDNSFDAQLQLEAAKQREMSQTSDAAEGISAFLEKRPANFTGT